MEKKHIDLLAGFAEPLHEKVGSNLSWGLKLLIMAGIDAVPFLLAPIWFFPFLGRFLRIPYNILSTLAGIIILGKGGAVQGIEVIVGMIPGVGAFIDFFPTLTLTCIFLWVQDTGKAKHGKDVESQEGGEIMADAEEYEPFFDATEKQIAIMGPTTGFVLGLLFWWLGFLPLYWIPIPIVLGFLLALIKKGQENPWVVGMLWFCTVTALCLSIAGIFKSMQSSTVEDWHTDAWFDLRENADTRVKKAMEEDVAVQKKERVRAEGGGTGEKVIEVTKSLWDTAMEAGRKHDFGVPALNDWFHKEPKPKVPATPKPAPTPHVSEEPDLLAKKFGLGTEQTKLFRSEYVLDHARAMRDEHHEWWKDTTRMSLIILVFSVSGLAVLGIDVRDTVQRHASTFTKRRNSTPSNGNTII